MFHCFLTQVVNLLFRSIELQERVIDVSGKLDSSGLGNPALLRNFRKRLFGGINDGGPFPLRKPSRHFLQVLAEEASHNGQGISMRRIRI
jgi:hypothetical protein